MVRGSPPKYWAQSIGRKLYPLVIMKMVQQPKHLNCLKSKSLFNPGFQQEAKAGAERLPWDNLEIAPCRQEPCCLSKPPWMSPCHRESEFMVPPHCHYPHCLAWGILWDITASFSSHTFGPPPGPEGSSMEGYCMSRSQWQAPRTQQNSHKGTMKEKHPVDISFSAI